MHAHRTKLLFWIVVTICIAFCIPISPVRASSSEQDALEAAVLNGMQKNREGLKCAVLVWDRTTEEDQFIPGRTLSTKGTYQMWSAGEKVAARYLEDKVYGGDGKWWTERSGEIKAFDGNEFRVAPNVNGPRDIAIAKAPAFGPNQNWFEIVQWSGKLDFRNFLATIKKLPNLRTHWQLVDQDASKLVLLEVTNSSDGAKGLQYFDPRKGFGRIREEWYDPKGRKYGESIATLELVEGGFWFPFVFEFKSINPDTGKITLHHTYSIRKKETAINQPAAIPDAVFTIPVTNEMEVSDYRGEARINYSLDVVPLAKAATRDAAHPFLGGGSVTAKAPSVDGTRNPLPKDHNVASRGHGSFIGWLVGPNRYWWLFVLSGVSVCIVAISVLALRRRARSR